MSITKRKVKGKTQYRYIISYKDAEGKYRQKASKWFDTASQAKKAEAEYRTTGKLKTAQTALTLGEALESYIEYKTPRVSPRYLNIAVHRIKQYYPNLLDKPIDKIQLKDILEAHASEVFQGRATSTKNKTLQYLSSLFAYADRQLGISCEAIKKVDRFVKTPEENLKEFNILTPEQFNLMLQYVDKLECKSALYVLFWTGMRCNECLSLTFEDIHETYIDLKKQYDRTRDKWVPLKTKEARRVSIDEDLFRVFQTLKDKLKHEFPDEFQESWFCFYGPKQIYNRTLKDIKDRALKKANLPYVRIHDLRHSHASYLIEQGVNIYKISKRLGHASIQMTLDRYGHLIDTEGDEILGAIKNKSKL